ncbi:hypothetical protein KSP40_PGU011684 [Platanthera guangdongensis]|uniref:Uncharacterized protein n=1 Tax=Platanthera guangdongensis TaxID=2320717 RepID=A0ABR2LRB4_9ASPA
MKKTISACLRSFPVVVFRRREEEVHTRFITGTCDLRGRSSWCSSSTIRRKGSCWCSSSSIVALAAMGEVYYINWKDDTRTSVNPRLTTTTCRMNYCDVEDTAVVLLKKAPSSRISTVSKPALRRASPPLPSPNLREQTQAPANTSLSPAAASRVSCTSWYQSTWRLGCFRSLMHLEILGIQENTF